MSQYRLDERGRLFRWDVGLQAWFRIVSKDDEYDEAVAKAVLAGPGQLIAVQQGSRDHRVTADGYGACHPTRTGLAAAVGSGAAAAS